MKADESRYLGRSDAMRAAVAGLCSAGCRCLRESASGRSAHLELERERGTHLDEGGAAGRDGAEEGREEERDRVCDEPRVREAHKSWT